GEQKGASNRKLFAERVRALIDQHGSASAIARLSGVSEAVVRKWRDGGSDPSRENLVSLAKGTGVSLVWLATGEGPQRLPRTSDQLRQLAKSLETYQQTVGSGQRSVAQIKGFVAEYNRGTALV